MNMLFADRVSSDEAGIFSVLQQKKIALLSRKEEVFDMSIGTPDFTPPPHVVEAMLKACKDPKNYKYAICDLPELSKAMIEHYFRHFGVSLNSNNVMSVNGSQEGLAHICFALCNPGDIVLVPDPGYPIFKDGPRLAGARICGYPLRKENNFLADLKNIPESTAFKAKAMIVSYPLNPVGVTAPDEFYEELIAFAKKYNIIIIHDNAYADIVFSKQTRKSFLAYEGAKEVGIELFSLSKTYNLTGARIAFVVGNEAIIRKFAKLRSLIDYGVFIPIQHAAIAALNGDQSLVSQQCAEYEKRAKLLCKGFQELGWTVPAPAGSIFVWAPIPAHYRDAIQFSDALMEKAGIICTPGDCFGDLGKGYVRFSLVLDVPAIKAALNSLRNSKILKPEQRVNLPVVSSDTVTV